MRSLAPCSFAFLRTKNPWIGRPASWLCTVAAATIGTAPISKPPTAVTPAAASRSTTSRAIRAAPFRVEHRRLHVEIDVALDPRDEPEHLPEPERARRDDVAQARTGVGECGGGFVACSR